MTNTEVWEQLPTGWPVPSDAVVELARDRTVAALRLDGESPADARLRAYYDLDGDYAGASFAELRPRDPVDLTGTDLHAVELLGVRIEARATRRLLDDGPDRREVLDALHALPEGELLVASPAALEAMEWLYLAVKTKLPGPNAWVVASVLCARKRPDLFPVRDPQVRAYLGLPGEDDYKSDWPVYRFLIGEPEVVAAVNDVVDLIRDGPTEPRVRLDVEILRVIESAIWTIASTPR